MDLVVRADSLEDDHKAVRCAVLQAFGLFAGFLCLQGVSHRKSENASQSKHDIGASAQIVELMCSKPHVGQALLATDAELDKKAVLHGCMDVGVQGCHYLFLPAFTHQSPYRWRQAGSAGAPGRRVFR